MSLKVPRPCSLSDRPTLDFVQQGTNSLIAVFVCVAALAILDRLDIVDVDTLAWWLAERQLPNGGLNGRPEKLEDVSSFSSSTSEISSL